MLKQQSTMGPTVKICARNLNHREKVIDVMLKLADKYKQSQKTRHYAIIFLDTVLEDENIFYKDYKDRDFFQPKQHLSIMQMNEFVLAGTCLLLASKFYEIDDNLIMMSEIASFMKIHYKFQGIEIKRCELQVLQSLNWDLTALNPLDYLQIYLKLGILYSDEEPSDGHYGSSDLAKKMESQALQMCDAVMRDMIYR